MSVSIKGGTVVTAEGSQRSDLLIIDDKIAAVGEGLEAVDGCRTIDAEVLCYARGIDPHTHMYTIYGYSRLKDLFWYPAAARWNDEYIDFVIPAPQERILDVPQMEGRQPNQLQTTLFTLL